jgi:hypothetical protein
LQRSSKSFSDRGRELLCRHHLLRQQRLHAHLTDDPMSPPKVSHSRSKQFIDEAELQFHSFRDLSAFMR